PRIIFCCNLGEWRIVKHLIELKRFCKEWSRRNRHGAQGNQRRDIVDYRTGYIRSHLRSPSGRNFRLFPVEKWTFINFTSTYDLLLHHIGSNSCNCSITRSSSDRKILYDYLTSLQRCILPITVEFFGPTSWIKQQGMRQVPRQIS
ncbi:hypothetical protein L9F63_003462, partial [Diploptera punctata]